MAIPVSFGSHCGRADSVVCRKRVGKGPLAAVVFFVSATAPVPAAFNLYFMRYSYVADHFYYLASMGLVALASAGMCSALPSRRSLLAVALPIVGVLGALNWQHCKTFRDEETLSRDTLSRNPSAWVAHNNLGNVLAGQSKLAEAVAEYQAALRIKPDYAKAHYNLGLALDSQGKVAEAISEYTAALQINPDDPAPHNNLGLALAGQGKFRRTITEYQMALRINADNAEAHNNMGAALAGQGKVSEAIAEFAAALRIRPDYAKAHNNLGDALVSQGKLAEATTEYQAVLRINPDNAEAHDSLGVVLARQGKVSEAIAEFAAALRIRPDYAKAHNNLGNALAAQGKLAEATAEYQAALRINPDSVATHNNLGVVLAARWQTREAIAQYREALRVRPDWPPALATWLGFWHLADTLVFATVQKPFRSRSDCANSRATSKRTPWMSWLPLTPKRVDLTMLFGLLKKQSSWRALPGSKKWPGNFKNG